MTTIDQLPVFTDVDSNAHFIGNGQFGTVYAINQERGLAAKFLKAWYDSAYVFRPEHILLLNDEYQVVVELYSAGISVPRPEGVFALTLPIYHCVPALVMEHVKGKNYEQLSASEQATARQLHALELDKVWELGFVPDDQKPSKNCLYRLEEKRVIMFDFGQWDRRQTRVSR
ncbi:serine/threonine protein kinase [Candidatus Woesearchaeota archaeon]|nr:serine/threonine protein kinase [Candidatus Woesearchaeota archaeon]